MIWNSVAAESTTNLICNLFYEENSDIFVYSSHYCRVDFIMDLEYYGFREIDNYQYCSILVNGYLFTRALFYYGSLTLISAWISNHTHYKVLGEITYPFLNFNGATIED